MGWTNSHLHEFRSEDRSWRYSDPIFEMGGTEDEFEVMLRQVAPARGATFTYVYDMGDYWEHRISVVDISKGTGDRTARCLAGERACPPEDVGGTSGYEHFLQVFADPRDEEYAAYAEWMPEGFDPERFDLAAINKRLATMEEDLDEDDLDGEDAIW
jgi:hypothetical protein